MLGAGVSQDEIDRVRDEMGLNDPIIVQYARYAWGFFTRGDLGTSFVTKQPVTQELLTRFTITIRLAFSAIFCAVLIGVPLGVISAVKQYTVVDSGILAFAVLALSVPTFWLGLLMISLFAVNLGWLPAIGLRDPRGWIMPILASMVIAMANYTRITRASMLESIRQDYIRTVRAKGVKESAVIIRHALRNTLIPIVAAIRNSLGIQLGGALVVESLFGLPGIGKYAVDAISTRNFPSVRGSVIFLGITFTIINLLVDFVYTLVDPRIKTALFRTVRKPPKRLPAVAEGGK